MSQNTETVLSFIDAWNAFDIEKVLSSFTEDAVYHNIPMEPAEGIEAVTALVRMFESMASEMKWTVHNIAETGDGKVLTERTDRICMNGQWIELPVMGTFEVRDGKIAAWRDYFDMAQFQGQTTS